jgi:hypothetical protein
LSLNLYYFLIFGFFLQTDFRIFFLYRVWLHYNYKLVMNLLMQHTAPPHTPWVLQTSGEADFNRRIAHKHTSDCTQLKKHVGSHYAIVAGGSGLLRKLRMAICRERG